MDQRLHRGAHDLADVVEAVALAVTADGQLGRPGDLLVLDHDGLALGALQPVEGLLDDLERLVHLVDADAQPVVGVAAGARDDVELVGLVAAVGRRLAQVVRQAGGAQHRAGHAERHAAGEVHEPDADGAALEQGVLVEQQLELAEAAAQLGDDLAHHVDRAVRHVLGHAAGADVGVVHPQPGDRLEDAQDALALTEADRHHGGGAELHAAGAEADQVGVDPGELHHQHPDDAGPLGHLVGDAEQLLDGQAVGRLLEHRRQVVHAGAERDALHPGAELHVLLDTGVQVADSRPGLGDGLAVELEDEAEHAVRRRVLRPHVDDDALLVERGGLVDEVVPVATGDVEHGGTLDALVHGGAVGVGGVVGGAGPGRLEDRGVLVVGRHQLYALRSSGGGTVPPLYSTGMPPRG